MKAIRNGEKCAGSFGEAASEKEFQKVHTTSYL